MRVHQILTGLALAASALTPDAVAQLTLAEAEEQLHAAAQAASTGFGQQLELSFTEAKNRIDEFQALVAAGLYEDDALLDLFRRLEQVQIDLRVAVEEELVEVLQTSHELLGTLIAEGTVDGAYPKAFRFSGKGVRATLRAEVLSAMDKRYAKLRKRLSKVRKVMKKQAGRSFSFHLVPPGPIVFFVERPGEVFFKRSVRLAGVDLLLASRRLDGSDDAFVCAGGNYPDQVDITVVFDGPIALELDQLSANSSRWDSFDGVSLPPGNWMVQVDDEATLAFDLH